MVIIINTLTVIAMIPSGAQIAGAVFVGNSLGEGSPKKAKLYLKMITAYTFIVIAICSSLLVIYKDWIAMLFTN